jgi:hypothetical protein
LFLIVLEEVPQGIHLNRVWLRRLQNEARILEPLSGSYLKLSDPLTNPHPLSQHIPRELGGAPGRSLCRGARLLVAPRRRTPEKRAYRIRPWYTQWATIASDSILEPDLDRQ